MLNWNLILTATLVASLSGAAQTQDKQSTTRTSTADLAQTAQPMASTSAQVLHQESMPASPVQTELPVTPRAPMTLDQVVDRFIKREHELIKMLSHHTPVVETYLQNLTVDPRLGPVPSEDHYFLARMDMSESANRKNYLKEQDGLEARLLGGFHRLYQVEYEPLGFSWMIYADRIDFDRDHYQFHYIRREFLGDVRCLVFDVTPKKDSGRGRFLGRLWVEDQDYNVVRLKGTYAPAPRNSLFFHMDSWRLNLIPGYWVPAYIYTEEGEANSSINNRMAFKAQTRIWGYDPTNLGKDDDLTQIRIENVKDDSTSAQDASPLQAKREWQRESENNCLERLTRAGLLAPEGEVDKILETVVNNLEATNNINLPYPVRTRVLLTAPLETFSVGNTIVISRGLIDVLPNEASLAAVLSHELAHIVLGHSLSGKYAFNDRMLFSDAAIYQNLGFRRSPIEEEAADKKAVELLKNSPYAEALDSVSLFLKALQTRAPQLSALLTARLGNSFAKGGTVGRLLALAKQGPELDMTKLDQTAALPLGGRIKINPWDDTARMVKTGSVPITSARDKMPFEVTPLYPRLVRLNASQSGPISSVANTNTGN